MIKKVNGLYLLYCCMCEKWFSDTKHNHKEDIPTAHEKKVRQQLLTIRAREKQQGLRSSQTYNRK
jgi:plasmid maintenance system killer protein